MNPTMLTPDQISMARGMWTAGATRDEIAFTLGVSIDTLRARLRDQLADLPPRDRRANSGRRGIDPTREEIMRATAEIRAGWPDERFLPDDPVTTTRF